MREIVILENEWKKVLLTVFCSWDKTYDRELTTYEDSGDVGEIWYVSCRVVHNFIECKHGLINITIDRLIFLTR